ncbi:hypothetical protein B0T18DRAFT_81204 [Schizothecium vesticola]|uniref:Inner membrane assembly complex subunit 17 n=1 Tax=Schizothecium vesticola TaxID=314040 RepID=A0AA40F6A8_9PEZI|nr:hypothetical protein B0T18DRAFT_81204 [Schizothecium vesticola]
MSRTSLARRAMLLSPRQPSTLTTSHPLRSLARRPYSTQQQPPSATGDFYKTFTRPVAKCLLFALFTYQLTYWAWLKLEQDEIKMERRAEIAQLENQVEALKAAAEEKKKKGAGGVAAVVTGEESRQGKGGGKGWWPF